jgi:hypothetical protein
MADAADFRVRDVYAGGHMRSGDVIEAVYGLNNPDYAVFRVNNRIVVLYADDDWQSLPATGGHAQPQRPAGEDRCADRRMARQHDLERNPGRMGAAPRRAV